MSRSDTVAITAATFFQQPKMEQNVRKQQTHTHVRFWEAPQLFITSAVVNCDNNHRAAMI